MANPFKAVSQDHQPEDMGSGMAERIKQTKYVDSVYAKQPSSPAPAKSADRPMKLNPKAKYGDRKGEQRIDVKDMMKPLGSYKKGGKIKKTGIYKLHKNERVLNPKQTKKYEKGSALSGQK